MKTILTTLVLAVLFINPLAAKIWRVNNNPHINADFISLQAAHDGASAGDTIHIEGSEIPYGSVSVTKQLIFIGPGFSLIPYGTEHLFPFKITRATTDDFRFQSGSAGSAVMGCVVDASIYVSDDNITIKRNNFVDGRVIVLAYGKNTFNTIISQNTYFEIRDNQGQFFSSSTITNNHTYAILLNNASQALIQNNVIFYDYNKFSNSTVRNNIFTDSDLNNPGINNTVQNNVTRNNVFGSSNGNIPNVNWGDLFVGQIPGEFSDNNYKLKPGSPAIGAGYGSTPENPVDAGMFGGKTPYVVSGLPPIPYVYSFEGASTGDNANPINVEIKVKSVQ